MCDYDCLKCPYPDCTADSVPLEDTDVFMQFHLDDAARMPSWVFISTDKISQEPAFQAWCRAHNVSPSSLADVEILKRAIEQGFSGKKLEKALYKVRHRDKYLAQKKRSRSRRSGRKPLV